MSNEMRVYFASLSDYNAGTLHGVWVDVDGLSEGEIAEEVEAMLKASPTAAREGLPAEEWSIHDYENTAGYRLGEQESLETIVKLAEGINEYGVVFAVIAEAVGGIDNLADDFGDYCAQEVESEADFAQGWAEETGAFSVPADDYGTKQRDLSGEWPFSCIDWQAAWESLEGFASITEDFKTYVYLAYI